jgi:hypothetical protein
MPRKHRDIVLGCVGTVILILVAAMSSTAFGRGTPRANAAAKGPVVGIISGTAGFGDSAVTGRIRQVARQTHAKWLRVSVLWNQIEPRRGVFRFRHYDNVILAIARNHQHALALLNNAPRWAAPATIAVPSDPSAYAEFVAAVAHRYGPGGTLWAAHPKLAAYAINTFDLWNEPYYPNGNNGVYAPGRYARLVRAAGAAGHAAAPGAKFLMAAEMQSSYTGGRWVWWVDQLYRAVPNLNSYFDGVSVHPYGHDIRHRSPAITGHAYYGYQQMRRIELIRNQFIHHGAGNKPFWATEVGWPTCRAGSSRCVSTSGQAASLRALLHYSRTIWRNYMRGVFIYYYDDARGSTANPDNDYGLTYRNHRPKPSLQVFVNAAKLSPVSGW